MWLAEKSGSWPASPSWPLKEAACISGMKGGSLVRLYREMINQKREEKSEREMALTQIAVNISSLSIYLYLSK